MTRGRLGLTVLAVWLAGLSWLALREYRQSGIDPLAAAEFSLPARATFFTISLDTIQTGFASTTVDTLTDTLRVIEVLMLELPAPGGVERTDVRTEALLSRALQLRSFTTTVRSETQRFVASGVVEGDSLLSITIETAGSQQRIHVPAVPPPQLPAVLPLTLAFGGSLRPGTVDSVTVFDPLLMTRRRIGLEVLAESTFVVPDSTDLDASVGRFVAVTYDTVNAYRVRYRDGASETDVWIDAVGGIVRAASPNGFTIGRSAFELAHDNFRRSGGASRAPVGNIVRRTAIAAGARLPTAGLETMRLLLDGDTVVLRAGSRPEGATPDGPPPQGRQLNTETRATPLVQSDDQRIQAHSRQIVGRTRDPEEVVRLLNEWVHRNLEKRVTAGVPNAVEALETRVGDASEHAALFVAFARAVGLPARTVAGLVYLDGVFYHHAWAEVHLHDWVPVDPTLGIFPAGGFHVPFAAGALARQAELLRVIGAARVQVLESNRAR